MTAVAITYGVIAACVCFFTLGLYLGRHPLKGHRGGPGKAAGPPGASRGGAGETDTRQEFKDKRGRSWELFCDLSYYDMQCVRCLAFPKEFNGQMSFHFDTPDKAEEFAALIREAQ